MEPKEYRVLTLWEPWATLVVHGIKKIETRPKPTSWTVEKDIFDGVTKGTYLIHAAQKWTKVQRDLCNCEPFISSLNSIVKDETTLEQLLNIGHIIGSVEVKECLKIESDLKRVATAHIRYENQPFACVSGDEYHFGDYTPGRSAWILQNPQVLKTPIPYKGGQGYYQRFKGDVNQLKFR